MTGQRFRPRGLGDIFDEAFDLYKNNFVFFLLVTAAVVVPLKILIAVITLRFLHEMLAMVGAAGASSPDPDQSFSWLLSWLARLALLVPLYFLALSPLVAATSARYLGEPITLWGAYRRALRRFLPLSVNALLFGAALAISPFFCGIGVLLPIILLPFTAHAVILENKAWGLGRSSALVSGEGSRVAGGLLLLWLLASVLTLGIQLPLDYALDTVLQITPGTDRLWGGGSALAGLSLRGQIVEQIGSGLAQLLLLPYLFSVLTVLYYDLRIRKEGFDIELLAHDLGYPALPAPGGYLPAAVPLPTIPVPGGKTR